MYNSVRIISTATALSVATTSRRSYISVQVLRMVLESKIRTSMYLRREASGWPRPFWLGRSGTKTHAPRCTVGTALPHFTRPVHILSPQLSNSLPQDSTEQYSPFSSSSVRGGSQ